MLAQEEEEHCRKCPVVLQPAVFLNGLSTILEDEGLQMSLYLWAGSSNHLHLADDWFPAGQWARPLETTAKSSWDFVGREGSYKIWTARQHSRVADLTWEHLLHGDQNAADKKSEATVVAAFQEAGNHLNVQVCLIDHAVLFIHASSARDLSQLWSTGFVRREHQSDVWSFGRRWSSHWASRLSDPSWPLIQLSNSCNPWGYSRSQIVDSSCTPDRGGSIELLQPLHHGIQSDLDVGI